MSYDFDFQRYVDVKKEPGSRRTFQGGFGEYAYASDVRLLRALSYAQPVRIAVEASVRAFKAWSRSDILGSAVRVGPRQFPRVYALVESCAKTLHIPVPTTYITQDFSSINAGTMGTDTDSFIIFNSLTADRLSDAELTFVIGHECGHIQNSHVTYSTALHFLTQTTAIFVQWIISPATLALNAWRRRAEVTCDRAGLLCCRDLDVAISTMVKLAVGSQHLVDEIDLDSYIKQADDLRTGVGRVSEYFRSHPYLPKRVQALQLFAESDYYKSWIGQSGGRPLSEIDSEVDEVISVL